MFLYRLTYISRQTDSYRQQGALHLKTILQRSRTFNGVHGITGMLFVAEKYFLQVLEGGRPEVNMLLGKIAADPRHTDLTVVSAGQVLERAYERWSMSAIRVKNPQATAFKKHLPSGFDPFELTEGTIERFLATAYEMVAAGSGGGDQNIQISQSEGRDFA